MNIFLDADSYIYKLAWFNKDETDFNKVKDDSIRYINNILNSYKKYKYENYLLLLSSKTNFRYEISDDYKANRKIKPKPKWIKEIYKIFKDNFNTISIEGYEADDIAATLMKRNNYTDILVHIDKDLLQIPGSHIYREELIFVSQTDAYISLFKQILQGDSTDNIKGIKNIGKVKAEKIVKNENYLDIFDKVIKEFIKQYKTNELGLIEFYKTYNLIKLKTDIKL